MREHFDFYAYCSPTSGKYYVDGNEYYIGEDFRTVKRYKEYKDAGFNILLLQHENSYNGEDFESSACNTCMENAYAAGIEKIIVSDQRIKDLCSEVILTGKNGRFATEKDLDLFLVDCTRPYIAKKGFFGLQLADEPSYMQFDSYGQVVKRLKKLFPDMYLQCNLLNIVERERLDGKEIILYKAYENYLNSFLDKSGADFLMYDDYPFRRDYIFCGNTLPNYQICAEICKKRGVEFRHVLQTFSWVSGGRLVMRRVTPRDVRFQANMAMGFGVREFSFFTYFTKPSLKLKEGYSTDGIDGTAMITRDGSRTTLYYAVKQLIKEMNAFASVILKYDYSENYLCFGNGKTKSDFEQTAFAFTVHACPIEVKTDRGVTLITKHVGKDKKSELFMLENIGNIKDEYAGEPPQKISVCTGAEKKVTLYLRGKKIHKKITNGRFSYSLPVGEALFIEIEA